MSIFKSNAYSIINDILVKIFKLFIVLYSMAMALIALDWFIQSEPWNAKTPMYAIVYGSEIDQNWKPSLRLQATLDTALDLINSKKVERIIVSWGISKSWFDEADIMKKYLLDRWVKIPWVIADSQWYTIMDTSKNAYKINQLRWKYPNVWVVGVSQFFHISRVKLSLKKSWFKYIGSASPDYFEWRDVYSLLREVPAYFRYFFMWVSDRINIDKWDLKIIWEKVIKKISED